MAFSAVREISIAHSPDSDDAFMFYGLATNKVRVGGHKFTHVLCDIETLNQRAIREAFFDVTAISFHVYPYIQEQYALMTCGGSVGEGYGPMIVAVRPYDLDEIRRVRIAVPGTLTTAYLALKLFAPEIETAVVPFDQIIPEVMAGNYQAGLIIHEGQLTYPRTGLNRILDLGVWWREQTGLPLPLGGNAIRRSLGPGLVAKVSRLCHASIAWALDHRDETMDALLERETRRDLALDRDLLDRYLAMYANADTLHAAPDVRLAIDTLYARAHAAGLLEHLVRAELAP